MLATAKARHTNISLSSAAFVHPHAELRRKVHGTGRPIDMVHIAAFGHL
jgi:hypothetical protein